MTPASGMAENTLGGAEFTPSASAALGDHGQLFTVNSPLNRTAVSLPRFYLFTVNNRVAIR
ncbi:hypothetical protein BN2476_110293 [Paraburkholderia piptadeniae]|uniref:Uncharacterized protein n=1 Tax=Paraburkholderia piptadeniae TaxID=1701573 RepID=A0A1N7RRY0_9BURK|nr:hypothetical protein BN2476_110293 [Paraburkholderia piptadeniae]